MARFYSNENFPLATVRFLREMGHDVLTSKDAGRSDLGVSDSDVLAFATEMGRCVLTSNRLDFMRLHAQGIGHAGIIVCTTDGDFRRLARHIDEKVRGMTGFSDQLIRVYRGP